MGQKLVSGAIKLHHSSHITQIKLTTINILQLIITRTAKLKESHPCVEVVSNNRLPIALSNWVTLKSLTCSINLV
jgi:hypothetical protein